MAGREGEPLVHMDAVHGRQRDIGHVGGEPGGGSRCIDEMFAELGGQCRTEHTGRSKHTVADTAEKQ